MFRNLNIQVCLLLFLSFISNVVDYLSESWSGGTCVFLLSVVSLVAIHTTIRMYLHRYNCDVTCTPMIVSDSFVKSQKARDVDFTTSPGAYAAVCICTHKYVIITCMYMY